MQTFRLVPYPASNLPKIHITGEFERIENRLFLRYSVTGEVDCILLPASSGTPSRKDDLWKATCFEFFLAVKDQPGYWEFNLSPSSDWNVYAMDAYRQINMRQEMAFKQLPFEFRKTAMELALAISVDLHSIFPSNRFLQLGITAIMQTTNYNETYWALAHPGPQADFHLREGLVIET